MKKIIAILFVSTLVSGCTSLTLPQLSKQQQATTHLTPQAQQQALSKLQDWDIKGAFSIQQPNHQVIANYQWQQHQRHYIIRIYSSLDLASITLEGDANQASLVNNKGQIFHANSLSQLMQQQLGWQLPVNNLQYWIRGLIAPGKHHAQYSSQGLLQNLTQAGFSINFTGYQRFQQFNVPRLINISGHNIDLRIAIKSWQQPI